MIKLTKLLKKAKRENTYTQLFFRKKKSFNCLNWIKQIRLHSYMTSDVFWAFLTYLPTLIRYLLSGRRPCLISGRRHARDTRYGEHLPQPYYVLCSYVLSMEKKALPAYLKIWRHIWMLPKVGVLSKLSNLYCDLLHRIFHKKWLYDAW